METSLHRSLKERYGPERGGRAEVVVAGYRIDAVGPDGELVEIQCGSLGPLRPKVARLLDLGHRVRVVKPIVLRRRIIRRSSADGPDLSARWSPRRGSPLDLFDDLVGLAALLAEPGLSLDVVGVVIEESRIPRRRGYSVLDRQLREIVNVIKLDNPEDLRRLMPEMGPVRFTTTDLSDATGRPVRFAQKVAYCLRQSGAARRVGKVGNRWVYAFEAEAVGVP